MREKIEFSKLVGKGDLGIKLPLFGKCLDQTTWVNESLGYGPDLVSGSQRREDGEEQRKEKDDLLCPVTLSDLYPQIYGKVIKFTKCLVWGGQCTDKWE